MDRNFQSKGEMIKEYLLDLVFPQRCPLCGKAIKWNSLCCDGCLYSIRFTGDEFCHGCGNHSGECSCGDWKKSQIIRKFYAAAYYYEIARTAVIYNKQIPNILFPSIAAEKIAPQIKENIDYIIPVPMGKIKQRKRGYNQAELFANALSKKIGAEVLTDVLKHCEYKRAQHLNDSIGRKIAARKTYSEGNSDKIKGKNLLLCDDVMTTGATLYKCAELLLSMGARSVEAAAETTTVMNKTLLIREK